MTSNTKLIVAGSTVHLYKYSQDIIYGESNIQKKTKGGEPYLAEDVSKTDNDPNSYRCKKAIKLLLEANSEQYKSKGSIPHKPIFVTLTFKADINSVEEANPIFKKFILRLNYNVFKNKKSVLKYLVVVEFQKLNRQAVHYHVVFFNLPWIPRVYDFFNEVWGQGNANVKTIYDLRHLTNYVWKYITKEDRDIRMVGRKKYFCSRGLKKPKVFQDQILVEFLTQYVTNPVSYEKSYINKETQLVTDYKCFKQPKLNLSLMIRQYQTLIKHRTTFTTEQLSFSL